MDICPKCGKKIFLASRFVTMFDVDEEDQEECGMEEVSEEANVCIHFCEDDGIIDIWIEEPSDLWRQYWGGGAPHWESIEGNLPEPGVDVLCYTVHGDIKVGRWYDRDDLPAGRYWSIAGKSGGIGTSMEVKPPLYWMVLPTPPNNGMEKTKKDAGEN